MLPTALFHRLLLFLSLILISGATLPAATVLLSHQGSTDPTTEGWARSTGGSTPANMISSAYDDNGTAVWRIEDTGTATTGTGLYFQATMNATKTTEVLTNGWELSSTMKLPSADPNSSTAWATGSNTWVGYLVANDGLGVRRGWALVFGRNTSGQTLVNLYKAGTPVSRTLDSGYHDYSIFYDPVTHLATVLIDGVVWVTDYAGNDLGAPAGNNQVYWGDNNAQSTLQTGRAAYYESVQFTQLAAAPEPSRAMLLLMAWAAWCWPRARRKRRG